MIKNCHWKIFLHALASYLACSSPGAPRRGGGLPPTKPGLIRRTREQW